ncbi:glycosyltransferase family 4 protein [Latilactobacillus fuchuensis]|uniref:Cps1B protein n=1 Tax=Latilactobacillus fuchuensis DSM 14340 = JCM 11249 TaxID=1423747 RepID=A0A0R1S0P8_9LACO|nr:glycosyltransferase family 4 protein [Latilactobacillus fuchuensis]KRL59288.1 cps1B protein [Latilactobacillus fuchuensis DSM 14340 = JCM 11249]
MKITFLLPAYSNRPIGGYKVVYQYANFLIKNNYDVDIIYIDLLPPSKRFTGVKGKCLLLAKSIHYYLGLKKNKSNWFNISSKINEEYVGFLKTKKVQDADIIIATAWETCYLLNSLSINTAKKIYLIQGIENWSGDKEKVLETWKYTDIENVVISTGLKKYGESFSIQSQLIPNFIDHTEFYLTNRINGRSLNITMMYHENPLKGSSEGLEALKAIKDRYRNNVNIIIFGTDGRPASIPSNFEYQQKPNMLDLFNNSSIYLVPSHTEGWGLTSTEAMACGNALITTNNGGCYDFAIDNQTALITEVGSIDQMIEKLSCLIEDGKLRERLAVAGEQLVEKFSIDKSGAMLIDLLEDNGE